MATIEVATGGRTSAGQARQAMQVVGGAAALIEGIALIVSTALILTVEPAIGLKDSYWHEPSRAVPVIAAHEPVLVPIILFAALTELVVLPIVLSLHERLQALSPGLMSIATPLGVFGAFMGVLNLLVTNADFHVTGTFSRTFAEQAMPGAQVAYDATLGAAGLGLGLWTLLVSWIVLRKGGLPRWLGYFGVLVGIADLLALLGPPMGVVVSIPWFIGVGVALLRSPKAMVKDEL